MRYLLKIEILKIKHYRTFWIIGVLYILSLILPLISGIEFLKLANPTSNNLGENLNINHLPFYHFPDVWKNVIWVNGIFKIIPAIWVIISITNEYQYRTIRQNIIDGLSRKEFLLSKVLFNASLSIFSSLVTGLIIFIIGYLYTPTLRWDEVFIDIEWILAYGLELFAFFSYALLLGLFIRRSGLAIIILLASYLLEALIKINVNESLIPFFPLEAISNLVSSPFSRYFSEPTQTALHGPSLLIVMGWCLIFYGLSLWRLKSSDL